MKQAKSKLKRATVKKSHNVVTEKALKKLRIPDLREKLAQSKQPAFILLGNEKYEIPTGGKRMQFLKTLFETPDLKIIKKEGKTLTTQQVADLLNVSRPYVIKLIEEKKLKSHPVGTHRRIDEIDAIEFRKKMRNEQGDALDQLAEETEKLGLKFK